MKLFDRYIGVSAALFTLLLSGILLLATPANAGNTVLFSSQKGDITFPLSAPAGSVAGNLDNTVIGATTAKAGTFTTLGSTGTAPVPTGTGTPAIAAGSTDTAGEVTAGTSATSVVITFATAKANAPFCVVSTQTGGIASFAYAISTTAITVTQSATSGNLIDYHCLQH